MGIISCGCARRSGLASSGARGVDGVLDKSCDAPKRVVAGRPMFGLLGLSDEKFERVGPSIIGGVSDFSGGRCVDSSLSIWTSAEIRTLLVDRS